MTYDLVPSCFCTKNHRNPGKNQRNPGKNQRNPAKTNAILAKTNATQQKPPYFSITSTKK